MPNLPCLATLNISGNNSIEHGGAVELIRSLPASVTYLNMSDTCIGEEDCKALGNKLASSNFNIQCLFISVNFLSVESVQYVIDGLSHCTSLKSVDMSFSMFNCSMAKGLASALQDKRLLSNLTLASCNMDSKSVASLANGLETLERIRFLDLSTMYLTSKDESS